MLRVPLIPLKRNHKTQVLFMTLFIIVAILNMFILLPTVRDGRRYYQMFNGITTLLVFLTFLYASCKDPGVLRPEVGRSFLELLRDINPADLCPECKVIRSARSRHCAICNCCVERFDHHCPWVNNCVGIKNHNAFLSFLGTIWIKIIFHFCVNIYGLVINVEKTINEETLGCEQDWVDYTFCSDMCIRGYCGNKYVYFASAAVCIAICMFYFLLSTVLLWTHCKNYMANRTTNERFGRKKKTKRSSRSSQASSVTSSIMSMSDFEDSDLMESVLDENKEQLLRRKKSKNRRKGCCINCWKMAHNTKIVP